MKTAGALPPFDAANGSGIIIESKTLEPDIQRCLWSVLAPSGSITEADLDMITLSQDPAEWQIGAIMKGQGEEYSAAIFSTAKDCGADLRIALTPSVTSTPGLIPNFVDYVAVPWNWAIGDALP